MNTVQCIIIEDERPAQEVLQSLISRVEWLELKKTFDDALTALDYLQTHDVDVIFLDIQIPGLNGMEFLKVLKAPPQVIITSAYSQYALDAFDLDVRDYLMKPFSFERFLKALGRISHKPAPKQVYQMETTTTTGASFAFFNVNKTMVKVQFDDISYVESMREYVYIHTTKGRVVTKIGIGEMERFLGSGFQRIHRSFIVNISHVTAFNAEEVFIEKKSLPIGTNYKKLVEVAFGKLPFAQR